MKRVSFQLLAAIALALALKVEAAAPSPLTTCISGSRLSDLKVDASNTLSGPFTVDEVEKKNMQAFEWSTNVIPFGALNAKWLIFKAQIQSDDKLYFASHFAGVYMTEYILIRGNCRVASFTVKVLA